MIICSGAIKNEALSFCANRKGKTKNIYQLEKSMDTELKTTLTFHTNEVIKTFKLHTFLD
jgi:hypothetical protein